MDKGLKSLASLVASISSFSILQTNWFWYSWSSLFGLQCLKNFSSSFVSFHSVWIWCSVFARLLFFLIFIIFISIFIFDCRSYKWRVRVRWTIIDACKANSMVTLFGYLQINLVREPFNWHHHHCSLHCISPFSFSSHQTQSVFQFSTTQLSVFFISFFFLLSFLSRSWCSVYVFAWHCFICRWFFGSRDCFNLRFS